MLQGKIFERVDRSQFRLPILPLQRISLSLNFVNSSTGTYLSTTTSATAGSSSPSHGRTKRRGRSLWRCHCIPFTTTAILIGSLGIVLLVQLALLRDAHSKVTIAATSNLQVSPTTSLLELFLRDFQKNANNPLPSRQTMEAADAFFNGVPLTLQRRESKHFVSHSHCVRFHNRRVPSHDFCATRDRLVLQFQRPPSWRKSIRMAESPYLGYCPGAWS